jgi:predicted ABC-type ATPase
MYVVAGPPGSGKSRVFPLSRFGVDYFNADDRAAELNGNSYHDIPLEVRKQVNHEFELFIEEHIDRRKNFALETTLRTPVTFLQTAHAHSVGFVVNMVYVALDDVQINLDRIVVRAALGYHSAPARVLRDIHALSLKNLRQAIRECGVSIDELRIFDNTAPGEEPPLMAKIRSGRILYLAARLPKWVQEALADAGVSMPE